eukprot:TRINITY_DN584_c0_g2_i1.p1 TRINITY_DN584_c0_g2~~TRINITY_DN584_c0_g2_i1.p1  ORF type:complete len:173 (-),score=63.91 TRINITY_DN584_c0_g2_i1:132-650(-)
MGWGGDSKGWGKAAGGWDGGWGGGGKEGGWGGGGKGGGWDAGMGGGGWGGGKGGGWGGKGGGWDMFDAWGLFGGKGKGKGKSDNIAVNTPKSKKVFIGNLPTLGKEGLNKDINMKLKEHFKQAGDCFYAEVGKNGTGSACFKKEEETKQAVTLLNGSLFEGVVIEVKCWGDK